MSTHYEESAGGSSIDIEKPPAFSEEQLQYLESIFAGNLRIYSLKDLAEQDKLYEQFLVWNGQQMVLDHLKDLIRVDKDKQAELQQE